MQNDRGCVLNAIVIYCMVSRMDGWTNVGGAKCARHRSDRRWKRVRDGALARGSSPPPVYAVPLGCTVRGVDDRSS